MLLVSVMRLVTLSTRLALAPLAGGDWMELVELELVTEVRLLGESGGLSSGSL